MTGGTSPQEVLELVAAESGLALEDTPLTASLVDLGLPSFEIMRVVLALEEVYDVELPTDDLILATQTPIGELAALYQRVQDGR